MVKCKCGIELKSYWVWWERLISRYLASTGHHPSRAKEVLAASADDAILGIQGFRAPYLSHDVVRRPGDSVVVLPGVCEPDNGQYRE